MSIAKEKRSVAAMEAVIENPELLTEILTRLPAKPLGKFKSVSKQWLSLISSQSFALLQARNRRQSNPAALLIGNRDFNLPSELQVVHLEPDDATPSGLSSLSDYLNVSMVHVLQSCNGLLLCSSFFDFDSCEPKNIPVACDGYWNFRYRHGDHGRGCWYFVCNPTTKQLKRIPFPFEMEFFEIFLVFDPLKSSHYRIVSVKMVDFETDTIRIDLYMSETDSWRMLGIVFSGPGMFRFAGGDDPRTFSAYCNGNIHWCCQRRSISFYFNVETAQLKTIWEPPLAREFWYRDILYFGESRGSLYLVMVRYRLRPPLQFDVWEMASDCSGWLVRYRVDMDIMRIAYPNLQSFVILGLIRAEEQEGSILVLYADGKAMACNLRNGSVKEIGDLKPCGDDTEVFHYMETLISIA